MITITYENFMAALALFTALCVSAGWLLKIYKGVRKPAEDVNQKLDRDNKRLNALEEDSRYFDNSIKLLLRSQLSVLGHLKTNGNTQEITLLENDIKEFLLNN